MTKARVFHDISNELSRTYVFAVGDSEHEVVIMAPVKLHVSESENHRVLDSAGISHYIPKGWIHLSWQVKEGTDPFLFDLKQV